jgi:hypothetical protein
MSRNRVTNHQHFAEKQAGHRKRVDKILRQNIHSSLSRWKDITNVQKSCNKMSTFWWKAGWTSQMCWEKSCDKTSTCHQTAGRTSQVGPKILWQTMQISLQERMDMMSLSILGRVDVMSQVTNHPYRWTNITVVNCHSRQFVRWMLSLGRNVTWSVCGWTERQGTFIFCQDIIISGTDWILAEVGMGLPSTTARWL